MLARWARLKEMVPAPTQAGKSRLRGFGAAMITVIIVGACGSAAATPKATGGETPTPWPTNSPSPTALPSLTQSPTPLATPSPSTGPTPFMTEAPGGQFAIALGNAALLAPAADNGSLAGSEIDDFGFDLLRELDQSGNLCASPTSIALALAMVRSGAEGSTATEMDKILHGFGSPAQADEIVSLLKALGSVTWYDESDSQATPGPSSQPAVELDVSNAAFVQKGMSLQQAYLDSLSSTFGAGLGLLDYANDPEGARQIINKWASDQTKGRIPAVLHPGDIDTLTRIVLANAIYLKAAWAYPFDPDATKTLPFTRGDGSKVSVPTMAISRSFTYAAGSGYRAVVLPYTFGGSGLSMTIVVPDNMTSFVNGLTSQKLAAIDAQGKEYDVNLTLPRFSINSRTDLAGPLAAMGMPALFDPATADLSGITTAQSLYIAKVIHEANIDVVEKGTTAAAVTAVIGATMGGPGPVPPSVTFHVNQPFLYFIREQTTGAVLFMGRIDDPSAKS